MTDFLPYLGDVLTAIASADNAEQRQAFDRLLQDGAQGGWDDARPQVEDQLKAELGRGDRIAKGVTLYDLDLRLAKQVSLARAGGGSSMSGAIPMELRLAPDLLIAKSTTPSVFGSDFDPKFSLDFGVVIDFSINVQPEKMSLSVQVGSARLTGKDCTGSPYLDSQNVVADLAKFFAGTVSPWFGGPDYVALVEAMLARHDFAGVLNAAMRPVNDVLGQLAKEGMGLITALFPDAPVPGGLSPKAIQIGATAAGAPAPLLVLAQPLTGDGVIRGEIRWPEAAGAPQVEQPYANAFQLSASVPTGAAVGEFSQPTDVTHIQDWQYAQDNGDHVIRYALRGLPNDRPITVECATNAEIPWTGDATKIPMVERSGWTGAVTIHPGLQLEHKGIHADRIRGGAAVELNPQPIPPGHDREIAPDRIKLDHEGIAKSAESAQALEQQPVGRTLGQEIHQRATVILRRDNPSGTREVDGIDFAVEFVDKPR
jgi:hypothetical protein